NRGRAEFREAVARFYSRRFRVELDPETEIVPALGAKECIFNLNLAFLDPGTVALASDPGYPVYTGGPVLAGAEAVLLPLMPEAGFAPDFPGVAASDWQRARLMFINYPNNPTGAVAPDGVFERAVELAREHDVLVVHDASYTETTFDGYVAPSFLETPGARETGVEVFSLSKGWSMTGWRAPPKGTIYIWAPVPEGHTSASYCELVLEESGVVLSPGGAYGPNGEGFFRISLTVPDDRLAEAVERLRSSLGG